MPYGASTQELEVLRSLGLPSGYHGVYEKRRAWQVKTPWSSRPLGTFSSPTLAAAVLVQWWRERFGERWPEVFQARNEPFYELSMHAAKLPESPIWVYGVTVWEEGRPRKLRPKNGERGWPTEQEAVNAAHQWALRRHGLFAQYVMRRGGGPVYLRFP